MGKVAYILADNRSGSTLLDQLLGAHERVVSLGEVHHLGAYVSEDRRFYDPSHPLTCYCGEKLSSCPFWQRIDSRLKKPLSSLSTSLKDFAIGYSSSTSVKLSRRIVRRLTNQYPRLIKNAAIQKYFEAERVAADTFSLFDAIIEDTKAQIVVDSSKSPFRYRVLHDYRPDDVFAIVLGRDYRGVVHSKMKRGKHIESSATAWVQCMQKIAAVTDDIPDCQKIRIRYEDLCADPAKELCRICAFLDIPYCEALLRRPSENVHHIGGSPSKFDPSSKEIVLDTTYLNAFSKDELKKLKKIVGRVSHDWGYD